MRFIKATTSLAIVLVLGATIVAFSGGSAVATTATWSTATPVTYASGLQGSSHDDVLNSVSCDDTGACTAVGSVEVAGGNYEAFATTETNGVFANGQAAQFNVGVQNLSPYAGFQSVSCSSPGNCSAVGHFAPLNGGYEAFTDTQINGVWQTAQPVVFGAGVQSSSPYSTLTSISCASAGNCAAVGNFRDAGGYQEAFTVSEVNFVWQTAQRVNFSPGVQSSQPDAVLSAVSCSSVGNCAGVGSFEDANGNYQALWVNEVSGIWTQAVPAFFSGGLQNSQPDAYLDSVSCWSDGDCTAVGQFEASSGAYEAFGESESFFSPGQSTAATFASNTQSITVLSNFTSVSCPAAGDCTAVGQYVDINGDQEAFSDTQSNGSWGTAAPVVFDYGTQNNVPDEQFQTISCVASGECTAAGQFYNVNGDYLGFTSNLSNGNWQTPLVLSFASGVQASSPNVQTLSISCSSAGNCSVVGRFLDANGQNEAFTDSSIANASSTTTTTTSSPGSITASVSGNSATVSWAPGSPGTTYTVTASSGGLTCNTSGDSCSFSGLSGSTTYSFNVVAHTSTSSSDAGNSNAITTAMGSTKLPPMVKFTTTSSANGVLTVKVTNAAAMPKGWVIYSYLLGTSTKWKAVTLSKAHTFTIAHLKNGATYKIRLVARNSLGLGPMSAWVTLTLA